MDGSEEGRRREGKGTHLDMHPGFVDFGRGHGAYIAGVGAGAKLDARSCC